MHCQTVIKSKNKFRSFVGPTTETRRSDDGAVRNKKRLPKWQRHPHALSILKDTTTPKPRTYEYDGNGNPTTYQGFKDFRLMVWDEENRLQGINDNGKLHLYTYDHTGERAVKSSAESQSVVTNGQTSAVIAHTENYTAYINPYFVVNKGKFTKHYFEGTSRIVSKLGEGTFQQPSGLTAGGIDYIKQSAKMQEAIDAYVRGLNVPPGPPTQQGIYASPEWTGKDYPSISWSDISQDQEPPEGWPRPPKFNEPGDVPGPPVQYGDPVKPDNVKGGFGFKDNGVEEKNLYFYHPDHLGSSSYITDRTGKISQHTEYIAFGEVLFDEHTTEVNMPYLFNGKELDSETGLYYYGARYYDARVSLWLNVDPLVEKTMQPYAYTNNNPVMLIDPDGKAPFDWVKGQNGSYFWDSRVTSQSLAEKYWGKGVEHYKPDAVGYYSSDDQGYVLLSDNAKWVRNGVEYTAPDMAGKEPISTKIVNYMRDNFVLELEAKTSLGVQIGLKSGVFQGDLDLVSTDIVGFNIDLLNIKESSAGFLNERGKVVMSSGIYADIGLKRTPLSIGGGIKHSWIEKPNSNPFGYNSDTAHTNISGNIGVFTKGKGFEGYGIRGGNLQGSVNSDCKCLNIGIGAKVLFGGDINLKIGIKE